MACSPEVSPATHLRQVTVQWRERSSGGVFHLVHGDESPRCGSVPIGPYFASDIEQDSVGMLFMAWLVQRMVRGLCVQV